LIRLRVTPRSRASRRFLFPSAVLARKDSTMRRQILAVTEFGFVKDLKK
jgi:hypothetical protein